MELGEIFTAISQDDGKIKVIFKIIDEDPNGRPVHRIEVGETDIEDLLIALGWFPLLQENTEYLSFLMREVDQDAAILMSK